MAVTLMNREHGKEYKIVVMTDGRVVSNNGFDRVGFAEDFIKKHGKLIEQLCFEKDMEGVK